MGQSFARIFKEAPATLRGDYLHWDEVRRRSPPPGMTHEEWWASFTMARSPLRRDLPLLDGQGRPCVVALADQLLEALHEVDKNASGRIEVPEQVAHREQKDRYLLSSLIEEAITSSQLEGASTTRVVAKDMLRSGRAPRDKSEQMIRNNFEAMRLIARHRDQPLTPDLVLELQGVVTLETLQDPAASGRLRRPDEHVVVEDHDTSDVLHVPPPAESLPARLEAMCAFANGTTPDHFVHPVVRAILLHFWLAYDHPFVDGNGRTARALFYWAMLHRGYWLTEFISISRVLKRAPAQYARAFLYSETDSNDATYFLLQQLRVLRQSIEDLHGYLARKAAELREVETRLRHEAELNHRQLALLGHALRHPDARYTVESHRRSHGVSLQTARTDLQGLANKGLLESRRMGKAFRFSPAPDLEKKLNR
jgi:Fic family protein